jgi:hypothetical protein
MRSFLELASLAIVIGMSEMSEMRKSEQQIRRWPSPHVDVDREGGGGGTWPKWRGGINSTGPAVLGSRFPAL